MITRKMLETVIALNNCASTFKFKHDTRENLKTVHIEPTSNGAVITATDGHQLAQEFVPCENFLNTLPKPVLIPSREIKNLALYLKQVTKYCNEFELDNNPMKVDNSKHILISEDQGSSVLLNLLDDSYPDANRIFNKKQATTLRISFDPEVLLKVHKAHTALVGKHPLIFEFSEPSDQIKITSGFDENFKAVVMPCKLG